MAQERQPELWAAAQADLIRVQAIIRGTAASDSAMSLLNEFLRQNELGLACSLLEDYGAENPQNALFWLALRDAASKMGMDDEAERYQKLADQYRDCLSG